jgi:hypothetical protein
VSFLEFIGVLVLWVWFWSLADVVGSEGVGGASLLFRRWATKKAGGSTQNGRDSKPKNLGVKKYGGQVSGFSVATSGFCSCGFPCGCGRSRILLTFSQAGGEF